MNSSKRSRPPTVKSIQSTHQTHRKRSEKYIGANDATNCATQRMHCHIICCHTQVILDSPISLIYIIYFGINPNILFIGERPYKCDECPNAAFFSSSALKVHKRLHTGDKVSPTTLFSLNLSFHASLKAKYLLIFVV